MPSVQHIRTGLDPERQSLASGIAQAGQTMGRGLMSYGIMENRNKQEATRNRQDIAFKLATLTNATGNVGAADGIAKMMVESGDIDGEYYDKTLSPYLTTVAKNKQDSLADKQQNITKESELDDTDFWLNKWNDPKGHQQTKTLTAEASEGFPATYEEKDADIATMRATTLEQWPQVRHQRAMRIAGENATDEEIISVYQDLDGLALKHGLFSDATMPDEKEYLDTISKFRSQKTDTLDPDDDAEEQRKFIENHNAFIKKQGDINEAELTAFLKNKSDQSSIVNGMSPTMPEPPPMQGPPPQPQGPQPGAMPPQSGPPTAASPMASPSEKYVFAEKQAQQVVMPIISDPRYKQIGKIVEKHRKDGMPWVKILEGLKNIFPEDYQMMIQSVQQTTPNQPPTAPVSPGATGSW